MPKPVNEISCSGCLRVGQTDDSRLYCPECREDLERQACVVCSTPVKSDVPHVLCDACLEECRLEEQQDCSLPSSNDGCYTIDGQPA